MSTLIMYAIIIVYFCISIKQVFGYKDPQISVYQIMEDRGGMTELLNMEDHHMSFVFGFIDSNFIASPLDPKIGRFDV